MPAFLPAQPLRTGGTTVYRGMEGLDDESPFFPSEGRARQGPSPEERRRRMQETLSQWRNNLEQSLDRTFQVGMRYPTPTSVLFPLAGTGDCWLRLEFTEREVEDGAAVCANLVLTLEDGDGSRFTDVNWGYTNAGRLIGPIDYRGEVDYAAEAAAEIRRIHAARGRPIDRAELPPRRVRADRRRLLGLLYANAAAEQVDFDEPIELG